MHTCLLPMSSFLTSLAAGSNPAPVYVSPIASAPIVQQPTQHPLWYQNTSPSLHPTPPRHIYPWRCLCLGFAGHIT